MYSEQCVLVNKVGLFFGSSYKLSAGFVSIKVFKCNRVNSLCGIALTSEVLHR